ncbi:hypothetical protein AB5I41_14920 [Sphingomonas sp. MMS24-JH45]
MAKLPLAFSCARRRARCRSPVAAADTLNLDSTGLATWRARCSVQRGLQFQRSDFGEEHQRVPRVKMFAGTDNDNGAYRFPVGGGFTIPFCVFCAINSQNQQFSQELQLLGDFDRASFIFGGDHFRERATLTCSTASSSCLSRAQLG